MAENETIPKPESFRPSPLTVTLVALTVVALSFLTVRALTPVPSVPLNEAEAAKAYLRDRQPESLSGPLQKLLGDTAKPRVATQQHALLNQKAPAINLLDVDGKPVDLDTVLASGPAVVVFYYGYSCNHCVAQLFGVQEDRAYFRELGATVLAISPDTAEKTKARYAEYGAFDFPVLSDKDRSIASRYGVYRPKVGDAPEWEVHGTFVIDRGGIVRWTNTGDEPFIGNATLLAELARIEDRNPGTEKRP